MSFAHLYGGIFAGETPSKIEQFRRIELIHTASANDVVVDSLIY